MSGPSCSRSRHFGDAELYWRIADANVVTDPFELTDTLGRGWRIPAPSGVQGASMLSGVQLSLKIGPGAGQPRRTRSLEALVHAKVEEGSGDTQSGFELTFELPARSPLRTLFLLSGGGSLPLMRVVLVVTINGMRAVDHRRRHHQRRDAARRGRRVASGREGQGPVGRSWT